jgi:hypothetical protein
MAMRMRLCGAAILAVLGGVWCSAALAQATDKPAAGGTVVLNGNSFWRMHQTLKPPLIRGEDGGLKPLVLQAPWVDRETAPAEENWFGVGFDDHRWLRGPGLLAAPSPFLGRLCLRGKFNVTDVAQVQGLKLSVAYHGGVIVYVNGQELTRAHIAAGRGDLAEDYPAAAYVGNDGNLLPHDRHDRRGGDSPQLKMIQRSTDIEIPAKMLRAGVNVIAIDLLRAPYPRVLEEKKAPKPSWWIPSWDNCELDFVQLTAASATGLAPNTVRPAGFQVWNGNVAACDYDLDYGDPTEQVQPIEIVAARNGVFSGKVVVGSTKPIAGLKAFAGELKGAGGVIAASAVETRFALPWGREYMSLGSVNPYPAAVTLLSCLCPQAPEVAPLSTKTVAGKKSGEAALVNGAVVPIWVTVRVPKDAQAGSYRGELTIQATDEKAVIVPLEVRVADWTLPDAQDHRTVIEVLQSPDTLAAEYKVPLWSDRHWELIAESFRLMGDTGSRTLHIPLIAETNLGHEQSMVRWVKKADGTYDYDFSILDKYLDTAEKNLGQPKMVILHVWEVYMLDRKTGEKWTAERGSIRSDVYNRGPAVTTWDAATGKSENVILPRYTEAGAAAQWKPLYDQLLQRLAKRGLDKTVLLGLISDTQPSREEVAFWAKIAPDVPWAVHSHAWNGGPTIYNLAKIGYQLGVWSVQDAVDHSFMGWQNPILKTRYWRQDMDAYPTAFWRELCQKAICGDQRGVGRLGGDYWEVLRDKNGLRKARIYALYPQSDWRNLDLLNAVLAPGPKGPVATQHLVNLTEGVQACEARIVVEAALSDPALKAKLGADLAGRCQAALDERMRAMQLCSCMLSYWLEAGPAAIGSTTGPGIPGQYWYVGSDWEGRDATLFGLAGEVQKKIAPGR